MSIKFKAITRINPRDLAATPKHYATAISQGLVDIDRLSELVADGSTVRQNDVYAVLIGLVNTIQGELSAGRNVRLDKLGIFSIGLSSEGELTSKLVKSSSVKSAKIRYRPSAEMKKMLKGLTYSKLPTT
jgi:predicted histone-like DNA-binding protein